MEHAQELMVADGAVYLRADLVKEFNHEGMTPDQMAAMARAMVRPVKLVDDMPDPAEGKTDTSQEAAKKISYAVTGLRKATLTCVVHRPQATSEIADYLSASNASIQPRTSELRDAGFIQDSGIRYVNMHGNKEIVWEPTGTGLTALHNAIGKMINDASGYGKE